MYKIQYAADEFVNSELRKNVHFDHHIQKLFMLNFRLPGTFTTRMCIFLSDLEHTSNCVHHFKHVCDIIEVKNVLILI